jgi:hypothetical protein
MATRFSRRASRLRATLLSAAALAACSSSTLPSPALTSIEPTSAFEAASLEVTIRGDRLLPTAYRRLGSGTGIDSTFHARLGGVALEDVRWVSSKELTARVPGTLPPGTQTLTVEAPNGTAELADAFVVIPIEHCASGVDDDGDGLVDCIDPDCEGLACDGGTCDAAGGCVAPPAGWTYVPSNFDPAALSPTSSGFAANCSAVFSTTTDSFTSDTCGLQPSVTRATLSDLRQATVLAFKDLTIEGSARLTLIGQKPAILAVFGNATIRGELLANSTSSQQGAGSTSYPMGGETCVGRAGGDAPTGSAGGGGAGYRNAGGTGGPYTGPGGAGGTVEPSPAAAPLRGGCPGGVPGLYPNTVPGTGGGALQLSVSGELLVSGVFSVSGQGGSGGVDNHEAGYGGGSGGTLVLEGEKITLTETAKLTASGGGGGGGAANGNASGGRGDDGATATSDPASGGPAGSVASGAGGAGGAGPTAPVDGAAGTYSASAGGGGAGGGGGSAGAIFVRSSPAQCTVSPLAIVSPPATPLAGSGCL